MSSRGKISLPAQIDRSDGGAFLSLAKWWRKMLLALGFAICCCQAPVIAAQAPAKKKDEKKADRKTPKSDPKNLPEPLKAKSPKGDQEFWYYVPQCYDPKAKKTKRLPLVLSYHGAGSTGQAEISSWRALAEQYGFVVACPTSLLAGAGQAAGAVRQVKPEEFFQESEAALSIVASLKEKLPIDDRKVMVTGFSGGGNPAYWLAFTHPEIFPFACLRCGNFPMLLPRLAETQPEIKQAVENAAKASRFYIFWGEKDHPIILGEIDRTLAWVNALHPAHCEQERVMGLGHESRPDKAAAWFAAALEEVAKEWKSDAKAAELLEKSKLPGD
ncbi:MAG: alpha/beta hydrolase-fold protein [Planctomycetota bacterium]|nr:alpha/beta hydrolase-fold protein [Planctomycetota bacterium]